MSREDHVVVEMSPTKKQRIDDGNNDDHLPPKVRKWMQYFKEIDYELVDTRSSLRDDLSPSFSSSSSSTSVSSTDASFSSLPDDNNFIKVLSIPVFWEFLTTDEHFRMSSISISARKAAFSKFNLSWRLKHQREFWKTARQFYIKENNDDESRRRCDEYDMKKNEHWDIFTRENILRTRHATPINTVPKYPHLVNKSLVYEEKVMIFNTAEECNAKAGSIYNDLVMDKKCIEYIDYGDKYFQTSLPCWTWALGGNLNTLKNAPVHISKIGGNPAVYKDNGPYAKKRPHGRGSVRKGRRSFEMKLLYQIDLSTIPIRLRELLGGSGLLQMFVTPEDDEVGAEMRIIPQKDFPHLTIRSDEEDSDEEDNSFLEVPIVGWAEKDDYWEHCEILEKFGGYILDVQNGYDENQSIKDKCKKCGRYRLSCKYLFEMRSYDYHNIFGCKLGDSGNLQICGCVTCGIWWTLFSCC